MLELPYEKAKHSYTTKAFCMAGGTIWFFKTKFSQNVSKLDILEYFMDMNNPIVPAVIAVVGVIVGSFIGGIIPHFLQKKSAYQALRRAKLEELYGNITLWINHCFSINIMSFTLVFKKQIDWNKYLDNINESSIADKNVFFKSEIIISLYFKELEADFIKLSKSFQDVTRLINIEIKKVYLADGDINIYKTNYDVLVKEIIILSDNLKNKIKRLAEKI